MSHVDEGALHAYLDGALDEYPSAEAERIRSHLDSCAECVGRLEVERRIRSDAHDLLGLAAPEVEVPSFEELRAYVQRTRRQREGIGRLQRLGWAASIVVAIGAGWMLRDGQLQSRALEIGRQGAPAPAAEPVNETFDAEGAEADRMEALRTGARAVGTETVDAAGPTETEAILQRVPDDEAGPGRSAVERRLVPAAEEEARVDAAVTAGAGEVIGGVAEAAVGSERIQPPETIDMFAAPGVAPDTPPAVEVPSEAVEPTSDAVEVLADTDLAAQDAGAVWRGQVAERVVPPMPAPDSAPELDAVAVTGRARDTMTAAETMRASEVSPADAAAVRPVTSALGVTRGQAFGSTQKGLSPDSVPTDPLLAVPQHEVLSVVNLGNGTTAWGVRVRQRTDDGRVFEVFHLEPGIDPSVLPDEGDGAGEVRAETGMGWVLIRGPLPERTLAELLGSLFPGDA